jgi:hypothetical protein
LKKLEKGVVIQGRKTLPCFNSVAHSTHTVSQKRS